MATSRMTLVQTRIANGMWEGVLSGAESPPALVACLHGQKLDGLAVVALAGQAGSHAVRLPLPTALLSEGVQTVLIKCEGELLASFALIAGHPLEDDLRAEIDLLRAELDLLKRAFRRHAMETRG